MLDLRNQSSETEENMLTFKIMHNKKKIGLQFQLLEQTDELAIITFSDLTKIKRYEKERLSSRFQDIYFRNMAHDVRTPLNAVRSTNDYLKLEITDPECLKMIALSESSCYIMLSMFDQINELQKIKFDKFILFPAMFDIREMLSNLFNKMRIQAEFLNLNMYLQIEQNLPKSVYADAERLERVLFVLF